MAFALRVPQKKIFHHRPALAYSQGVHLVDGVDRRVLLHFPDNTHLVQFSQRFVPRFHLLPLHTFLLSLFAPYRPQ
jgi:hypothetical protein